MPEAIVSLEVSMNNRLIYILISLMVISLGGIIWIQTSWIGDAIAEQEQDFQVRVNEALNAVNDSIDTEEVELFLKREFGGIDSLVNEMIFFPQGVDDHSVVEINVQHGENGKNSGEEMMIIHASGERSKDHLTIINTDSMDSEVIVSSEVMADTFSGLIWEEGFEAHQRLDSVINENDYVVEQQHRVHSMMKRFTFETLLTGDLKDRIAPKDLKEKIKRALIKEGIPGNFTYAVKNEKTGAFENDYISSGFDTTQTKDVFSKKLFQSDRRKRMNYTLLVQTADSSNFVWSQVWKMTFLSLAFTLLILLSFGYALYFIFKQKKVSQVKNDFINNMTHELKTPLASIALATASIKHPEIVGDPEEIRRLAKLIEDEKDRINSHVERVLDTAALDSGELKLSLEKVPVLHILKQAARNVELSLHHVQGTLKMPTESDLAVEGDRFHLTNVFTNILDNGIKYRSDASPNLKVFVNQHADTVEIVVQDNGIGMTAKQLKHAFEKFYRAETGNIHNRKGFGLGLSYVKSVVEKHAGQVFIESKPKEGTTVRVIIPKYE